jgi:hypothetical protein
MTARRLRRLVMAAAVSDFRPSTTADESWSAAGH